MTTLDLLSVPAKPDVVELLLRQKDSADVACADQAEATRLLPRFVGLSTLGIALFGIVQGLLITTSAQELGMPGLVEAGPFWGMVTIFLAFEVGLMGAQIAALPSWYFYALLTGIRTHAWRITVEAMRARATASVVLVGLLPVYLAAGLGLCLIFPDSSAPGTGLHRLVILGGFALPFVAGLAAPATLARVLSRMAAESRALRPKAARRVPMPLLMALAWTGLFSLMAPLGVIRVLIVLGAF